MKKIFKKKGKRILAVVLAALMVNSVIDYNGIINAVAQTQGNTKIITAFAELPEDMAYQQISAGAAEADIILPEELTVMVEITVSGTMGEADTSESTGGSSGTATGGALTAEDFVNIVTPASLTTVEETILEDITWKIDTKNSASNTFNSEKSGTIYTYVPILSEDYTVADNVELPRIQVQIGKKSFDQSVTIDGVTIHVAADEGVFPEEAVLRVDKITNNSDMEKIESAVTENVKTEDKTKTVEEIISFDITITDGEGNELQPDTDKGEVKVLFTQLPMIEEITNQTKADGVATSQEIQVFHMENSQDSAEMLHTTVDEGTVVVLAEHFSTYSVALLSSSASTYTFDVSEGGIAIQQGTQAGTYKVLYGIHYDGYYPNYSNLSHVTTYNIADNIPATATITITGSTTAYYYGITVDTGSTVKIKTDGLSIDHDAALGGMRSPFEILNGSAVSLTLKGDNILKAGWGYAGLYVAEGTALTINAEEGGTLYASGKYGGAGIGGNGIPGQANCGSITINSGSVTAYSYAGGAGIGTGCYITGSTGTEFGTSGSITITGGTVNASTGGSDTTYVLNGYYRGIGGAGIGGNTAGTVDTITITGGTVTASGSYGAAGIGSGYNGSIGGETLSCGNIEINGGNISVTGGGYGAASIGSGGMASSAGEATGSVTIGEGAIIDTNGGTITLCDNSKQYKLSMDIYDARLTGSTDIAVAFAQDGNILAEKSTTINVSNYHGNASLEFYAADTFEGSSIDITVTTGDRSWSSSGNTVSENMTVAFGEALCPVTLVFVTEDVSKDIILGQDALTVTNPTKILDETNFYSPGLIQKNSDGLGRMTIYLPANEGYTITVTEDSLNNGSPMQKENVTIYSGKNTVYMLGGLAAQLPEAFDLSNGSVEFGYENSLFYVSFYQSGASEPTKVTGILPNLNYTVIQSSNTTATSNTIKVNNWGSTTALLLTINSLKVSNQNAIEINASKVNLNLSGASKLEGTSNQYYATLSMDSTSSLTIDGEGSLEAVTKGNGAAIGTDSQASGSGVVIAIKGGTINTLTEGYGAGIGSGYGSTANVTVNISGGTINATTFNYGAAIGSGNSDIEKYTNATVNISGGTVIATTTNHGAAIGSGGSTTSYNYQMRTDATVNISGGTITALTTWRGAAIGTGSANGINCSTNATVNISGGTITATTGGNGAAIGTGYIYSTTGSSSHILTDANAKVIISGGQINAESTGSNGGAAIGSGGVDSVSKRKNSVELTISGGTIFATGKTTSIGRPLSDVISSTLQITGGSIRGALSNVVPTNGSSSNVYLITAVLTKFGAGKLVSDTAVGTPAITGISYGFDDVYTDKNSKIYLYLPENSSGIKTSAVFADTDYTGTVKTDGTGVLTKEVELTLDTSGEGAITRSIAYVTAMTDEEAVIYYVLSSTPLTEGSAVESSSGVKSVTATDGTATLLLNGLSENTSYTCYAVAKLNDAYSEVQTIEFKTLYPAPEENEVSIDYVNETLKAKSGLAYSLEYAESSTAVSWTTITESGTEISSVIGDSIKTIYMRKKASDSGSASEAVPIKIPARPSCTITGLSMDYVNETVMIPANVVYQFAQNSPGSTVTSWSSAMAGTDSAFDLNPGSGSMPESYISAAGTADSCLYKIWFRNPAAASESKFASGVMYVTIPARPAVTAPAAATENIKDYSITLTEVTDAWYKLTKRNTMAESNPVYQDSNEFTSLIPDTSYTFVQQIKAVNPSGETQGHFASVESTETTFTTAKAQLQLSGSLTAVGTYGQVLSAIIPQFSSGSRVETSSGVEVEGTWSFDVTQSIGSNSVQSNSIYLAVDGTTGYQATFTPSADADSYGNTLTATIVPTMNYLSLSDGTAASLGDNNKGTNGWYVGEVTVNTPVGYQIADSNEINASWGSTLMVTADMNESFPYYMKQTDTGYITDVLNIEVKKETGKPVFGQASYKQGVSNPVVNLWNWIIGKEEITVTLPITEEGSGLTESNILVTLTNDDGGQISQVEAENKTLSGSQTEGYQLSLTVPSDFVGTYTVSATDAAGNSAEITSQPVNGKVVVDTTAPTVTMNPSGTAYTAGGENALEGTVTDGILVEDDKDTKVSSGLKAVTYRIDSGSDISLEPEQTTFDSEKVTSFMDTMSISVSERGVHTVSVTVTDQAGNLRIETMTFKIYGEPVVALIAADAVTYDGSAIEEGNGKDFVLDEGGSAGMATYFYKAQGAEDSTYVSGLPSNAGSYTIKVLIAKDDANCFKAKEVTGNITIRKAEATGLTTSFTRNYSYTKGSEGEQSMALTELLPADLGTVNFTLGTKTDVNNILTAFVTEEGILTYSVSPKSALDAAASVEVNAVMTNYEDVKFILTVNLTDIYTITITNGIAALDGESVTEAKEGQIVTITAEAAPNGKKFVGWTLTGALPANKNATTTTFVMGTEDVSVAATYQKKSNGSGQSGSSGGSNSAVKPKAGSPYMKEDTSKVGWDAIRELILQMKEGGFLNIDMNASTVVPKEVFAAMLSKDITLVFDMGDSILWSVNGNNITDENTENIDFGVKKDMGIIPSDFISHVTGESNYKCLSLTHEGNFGFTAALSINLEQKNQGQYANLFYYNPESKQLELQSVGKILENGNAILMFSHASDYTVIISKEPMFEKAMDQVTMTTAKAYLYVGGTEKKSMKINLDVPDFVEEAVQQHLCELKITYQVADPDVVYVTGTGKVIAKKEGKTTITTSVTINGVQKSYKTIVVVKKAYITLVKSTKTLKKGENFTFQVKGYGVGTEDLFFSSSKKSIVVIHKKTGKAAAKSVGTDYIIIRSGNGNIKMIIKIIVT